MTDASRSLSTEHAPPPSLKPLPSEAAYFSLSPPPAPPGSCSPPTSTRSGDAPWVLQLPSSLPGTLSTVDSCAAGLWYALRRGVELHQPVVATEADRGAEKTVGVTFRAAAEITPPELVLNALRSIGAVQRTDGVWELARGKWYEEYPRFALVQGFAGKTPQTIEENGAQKEPEGQRPHIHSVASRPARPPQASSPVHPLPLYSRWIHWLSSYLCLSIYPRPTDAQWLAMLHGWLNDQRVDAFWKDSGDLMFHERWLQERYDDPHVLPVLGSFRGVGQAGKEEPFGYFEIYWAAEDKIGKYYSAQPYDRGLHMLVGSQAHRGPHRVSAWLPSLVHYAFASDDRTQRVVSEPDRRNAKMVGYLEAFGFTKQKEVDVGNKVAALMICERKAFYELCPL